jgi:hypothetical protein
MIKIVLKPSSARIVKFRFIPIKAIANIKRSFSANFMPLKNSEPFSFKNVNLFPIIIPKIIAKVAVLNDISFDKKIAIIATMILAMRPFVYGLYFDIKLSP